MGKRKCYCVRCQRGAEEVGPISRTGLCASCGKDAQIENAQQIIDREGPYYERWLAGIVNRASLRQSQLAARRSLDATR